MTTPHDLARKACEALSQHSGDKQKLGLEVREYVPTLSAEERKAHAARLAVRNASMALVQRRPVREGTRVLRTCALLWNREDQKVESPGS